MVVQLATMYVLGVFVCFAGFAWKDPYEEREVLALCAIFWPVLAAVGFIAVPFLLIGKAVDVLKGAQQFRKQLNDFVEDTDADS